MNFIYQKSNVSRQTSAVSRPHYAKASRSKQLSGFTLLEVTAVLGLVTVAFAGIAGLFNQSLKVQSQHQHYVAASMLAQEGIEMVRNRRDRNWLEQINWSDGLVGDSTYTIEYDGDINDTPDDFSHADTRLFIDGSGLFSHDNSGTLTPYRRMITVVDNGSNLEIDCRVEWSDRGNTQNYTVSTLLYDWR